MSKRYIYNVVATFAGNDAGYIDAATTREEAQAIAASWRRDSPLIRREAVHPATYEALRDREARRGAR